MTKHTIKGTYDSDVLCRSMYDTIRSFMSECCIALWIPVERIMPEWLPRFEAHGLHLEKRAAIDKKGVYEYLVRNERRTW
jgi:hypothetical protein